MNDHTELFVGQHGVWRDDVERRVACNILDPFVEFVWQNFASFNGLLGQFLLKLEPGFRDRFTEKALYGAAQAFVAESLIDRAVREARPLEWFTQQIMRARIL